MQTAQPAPAASFEAMTAQQLVEYLSSDWSSREPAIAALAALGAGALAAIRVGLQHADWQVRAACAGLLDHLADARCVEPLREALNDPSPHVRRNAVHSLGCQRCKIAPLPMDVVGLLIERALFDSSIRVRRVAVHQLGLQPYDGRAVDALRRILRDDTDMKLRTRAEFALRNLIGQTRDL